ncbi:MAG: FAD-dependent oxidoreductase [Elusimicrobiota bacterium]|jgi:L-aspartate oxidase|nr:FAD-dependent oxidoreductase [Elusimicrobiota bacterium]
MKIIKTDCLIIGSGIAGSLYAYIAAKAGLKCALLAAADLDDCNSSLAQGGVIYEQKPDYKTLLKDIQTAGCNICNDEAVLAEAAEGFAVIEKYFIKDFHTAFDRDARGALLLTQEAAHSKKRIIFSKDTTGKAMTDALQNKLKNLKNLTIFQNTMAVDLLTLSHSSVNIKDRYKPLTCFGAYALDTVSGQVFAVAAKKTVLATGGAGQIYKHTTNSQNAYGHGIAMAYRIGARVMNMEYTQFHPTVLAAGQGRSELISEAVRGEGAVLVNAQGRAFMERYHKLKDLAPRDVVARAIEHERLKTGADCVYLDLSAMKPDFIKKRFPHICQTCLEAGIDITRRPIPVVPAMHYFCGGIWTDGHARTNIRHLNAVGECACNGFHGANRLASTSLLDAIATAAACARADIAEINGGGFYIPRPKVWQAPATVADGNLIAQDISVIKNTMWNYVGLIRSGTHLRRAEKILRHLKNEIDIFYKGCRITPDLLNLRSGAQTALLITYAALMNKNSRGAHYRED